MTAQVLSKAAAQGECHGPGGADGVMKAMRQL